jgi:4'-phosphopantetheinyl transferase
MEYVLVYKQQHEIHPDLSLLDAGERARYERLLDPRKQLEFLTGRTFLKNELATYLDVAAGSIFLSTTVSGKPYLSAVYGNQRPYFSMSHTNGCYLIGLSTHPIGVDIEEKRSIDLTLFQHFFTQTEHTALLEFPEAMRSDQFLRLFTAKEAFLKATDKRWTLNEIQFVSDRTTWKLQSPTGPYQFHQLEKATIWLSICLQLEH